MPEPMAPLVVLLVEDETLIRELIAEALEDSGFGVIAVGGGDDALRAIEAESPKAIAAVVTDVRLGGRLTGWDVARHARARSPSIPVIYITGDSQSQWPSLGVPQSLLMAKPFTPTKVVVAISTLLNRPETGGLCA